MGELAVVIIFAVVILVIKAVAGGSTTPALGAVRTILRRGVPARGILLSVSNTPSGGVGTAPWRYQLRSCVMDIEIPGQPPYEAAVMPYIPTNLVRDVLPGATVELRVDPRRPTQVVIIGPGAGFNAALLNASPGQGQ